MMLTLTIAKLISGLLWFAALVVKTPALIRLVRRTDVSERDPDRFVMWFIALSMVIGKTVGVTHPCETLSTSDIRGRLGVMVLFSLCALGALWLAYENHGR